MPHTQRSPELDQCIQACLDCYRACQQTALQHCLEEGGKHTEPRHFRLMLDCAEICRTSAAMMLSGSEFHTQTCGICAEICRACAESCRQIGGMEECVTACERCAESCERMSGGGARAGAGQTTSQSQSAQH